MKKSFEVSVARAKDLIEKNVIHPASLLDLARNRLMRLREWADGSDYHNSLVAEAEEVLYEAKALVEAFNKARGYI